MYIYVCRYTYCLSIYIYINIHIYVYINICTYMYTPPPYHRHTVALPSTYMARGVGENRKEQVRGVAGVAGVAEGRRAYA